MMGARLPIAIGGSIAVHALILGLAGLGTTLKPPGELPQAAGPAIAVALGPKPADIVEPSPANALSNPERTDAVEEESAPIPKAEQSPAPISPEAPAEAPAEDSAAGDNPQPIDAGGSDEIFGASPGIRRAERASPLRITEPEPLVPIVPEYPVMARRTGMEGIVVLDIDIDSDGRPLGCRTVGRGVHHLLEDAAVKAAMASLYKPGTENDVPVPAVLRIRVVFELSA